VSKQQCITVGTSIGVVDLRDYADVRVNQ